MHAAGTVNDEGRYEKEEGNSHRISSLLSTCCLESSSGNGPGVRVGGSAALCFRKADKADADLKGPSAEASLS